MLSARFLELLPGQAVATVGSGTKARFLFGAAADLLSAQLLQVEEGEPVKKTDEAGPVKKTPANEARAQDSKTANVTFADQVTKDKAEKAEGPPKKAVCLVVESQLSTRKRAARQESARNLQSTRQQLSAHSLLF